MTATGLRLSFSYLVWIVKRVYSLDLTVYDVNPVNDVIYAVHCFHIEHGRNIISVNDVLLQLDALDHWQDTR